MSFYEFLFILMILLYMAGGTSAKVATELFELVLHLFLAIIVIVIVLTLLNAIFLAA